jgi:hypothetical protein
MRVAAHGALSSGDGMPFHGTASRGVLGWLTGRPGGVAAWERLAHRLHDGTPADEPTLQELRVVAARHGVLSLSDSAQAAAGYVARWAAARHAGAVESCELWNPKEGHTSSVWFASPRRTGGADSPPFVVNVARDDPAGRELRATSERLRALAAREPGLGIAAVLDIAVIPIDSPSGPRRVTVTRNELVAGALEVHRLPPGLDAIGGYALVERFLTDPGVPARIRAVRGRRATACERVAIDESIRRLAAAGRPGEPVEVDLDHGDVIWDGRRPVVVAIS